jgi:hypothetical protein
MNGPRRKGKRFSHPASSDSETPSPVQSSFSSPEKTSRTRRVIVLGDEDDSPDELAALTTPQRRISSAPHLLRQPKALRSPPRAPEDADRPARKRQKTMRSPLKISRPPNGNPPGRETRGEVRSAIAAQTAVKRANFFLAKRDIFLPLLPEVNHVTKLLAQLSQAKPLGRRSRARTVIGLDDCDDQVGMDGFEDDNGLLVPQVPLELPKWFYFLVRRRVVRTRSH